MKNISLSKLSIPADIKVLFAPIVVILVSLIVLISVIKIGYSKISVKLGELRESSNFEKILEEKVNILSQIRQGVLEQTNISVIAVPEKNPSPLLVSLIKTSAQNNSIDIDKLDSRGLSREGDDLLCGELSVDAFTTESKNISNFIGYLIESIPLVTIDEIKIEREKEQVAFSMKGKYYWSSFPTKLPPIMEPIRNLSSGERSLLGRISNYNRPSYSVVEPQEKKERLNPFD